MNKQETASTNSGECQQAGAADPLFRLLRRFSTRPGLTACLTAIVLSIWYFASGLIVDAIFKGQDYVSILDPSELSLGLFIWVFWVPVIVFYYLWQPGAVLKLIAVIENNGVFRPESAIVELRTDIQKVFRSLTSTVIALLVTVAVTLIETLIVVPQESAALGKPTFWFVHWSISLIFFPVFAAFVYALIAFVLRNIAVAWKIHQFFAGQKDALVLQIFHPDRCGGMLPLGKFSLRLGLLAVLFGIFASFLSWRPVFWGGEAVLNAGTVAMYFAYVILVPVSIMPYIWSAHKAMDHFKQKRLLEISDKIDTLISEAGDWTDAHAIERVCQDYHIDTLVELYDLLEKRIPVWPISLPRLKSFGITAILPLLSGLFQVVWDTVQRLGLF